MDSEITSFLDFLQYEKKYSNHTITNYERDLDEFKDYINSKKIDYKNLNYSKISEYLIFLSEKKYSPSTVNRHLSAIRSFYAFLLDEHLVNNSPFKMIHGPKKEKKLPNYLKYQEFVDLIDSLSDTDLDIRNRMILELLFATGVRVSELVNIKLVDISFKECEIKVFGKGKKMRIVYFNKECQKVMSTYVLGARQKILNGKKNDYLIINHLGNKITPRGVEDIIDKCIQKSSLNHKISPHTLRHTFATLLLNEGMDIREVQELLGHARLSTTSIYTHVSNENLRQVYLKNHPRAHTQK